MSRQLTTLFALAGLTFGSEPLSAQQVAHEYVEETRMLAANGAVSAAMRFAEEPL